MSAQCVALARVLMPAQLEEAIELLDEREIAKLELMVAEIEDLGRCLTQAPIKSREEEGRAAELMNRWAIAAKELESLRQARVAPLNREVKAINDLFHRVADRPEATFGKRGTVEKAILAYRAQERTRIQREQEEAARLQREAAEREAAARRKAEAAKSDAARQKLLAAAEAASQAQTAAALAAPMPMTKGVWTDSGKVTETARWTFEVVDPSQVPRQYLCVDEKALRAAVAAGAREIPGVNVFQEESLRRNVGR